MVEYLNPQERASEIMREMPEVAACIHRTLSMRDRVDTAYSMTKRQRELMLFIQSYSDKHGYCPSYDEMRDALGLNSKSGIHRLAKCLEERGFITSLYGRARSIRLEARV